MTTKDPKLDIEILIECENGVHRQARQLVFVERSGTTHHLQMFVTEDWQAPAYTIRLTRNAGLVERCAAGHAYIYYSDGPKGRYSGEAFRLTPVTVNLNFPPLEPAIQRRS